MKKKHYNSKLLPDTQISAEEKIAAIIFDHPNIAVAEVNAQSVSRKILKEILLEFRPDLFE